MTHKFNRIVAVVGHYGSGKTNLAVNLALDMKAGGQDVTLVDLDIVNPYFRSADFRSLMETRGIGMIAPVYANSNLDIPALTGELDGALDTEKQLVLDVGGDDAGATALGRYSGAIAENGGCELIYVVNRYRYLTQNAADACEILDGIERTSRLKVTGIVNNSHLTDTTTAEQVAESIGYAKEIADIRGLPLLFTAVTRGLYEKTRALAPNEELYPVDIYVKKPWEV